MKTNLTEAQVSGLVETLIEIRSMAMEHPAFDADCFKIRDLSPIINQCDKFDWTFIALRADDALKSIEKP